MDEEVFDLILIVGIIIYLVVLFLAAAALVDGFLTGGLFTIIAVIPFVCGTVAVWRLTR